MVHTLCPKMSIRCLTITLAHTNRFWYFCANVTEKVGNQKVRYFPISPSYASAPPGEIGNPKIASFRLNAARYYEKHTKCILNITWSQLNHPSRSKRSTVCTRQDLGRQHSTCSMQLDVYQVCHYFSRCMWVKQEGQHPLTGQRAPPISGGT